MRVIDQFVDLLSEGSMDAAFRERAMDVLKKVLAALPKVPENDFLFNKTGEFDVFVNLGKLIGDESLSKVDLHFVDEKDKKVGGDAKTWAYFYVRGGRPNIAIVVAPMPEARGVKLTPEMWKRMLLSAGNHGIISALKKSRSSFIHEFVHFLDYTRISADKKTKYTDDDGKEITRSKAAFGSINKQKAAASSPEEKNKAYVNNPIELNAFVQQAFYNIEHYVDTLGTFDRAKKMLGKTPQEFSKKVFDVLKDKQIDREMFTEPNVRKIQKRSYQLWQDLEKKYGGVKNGGK